MKISTIIMIVFTGIFSYWLGDVNGRYFAFDAAMESARNFVRSASIEQNKSIPTVKIVNVCWPK